MGCESTSQAFLLIVMHLFGEKSGYWKSLKMRDRHFGGFGVGSKLQLQSQSLVEGAVMPIYLCVIKPFEFVFCLGHLEGFM